MKKKLYITRTLKLISFALVTILTVAVLQQYILCHYDNNRLRLDGYYLEEKNSIDVVMLGSSEMYADFSPALAYEKFGFTSYPYATASSTAGAMKTQLKEVLRTQNPKLIVIEINAFLYATDNETKESSIRNYIDNVPLNGNKIEYINNYIDDDKLEYYFPIFKYHGAWNDYPEPLKYLRTTVSQHQRGYTYLKGFKTKTRTFKPRMKVLNDTLAEDETRNDIPPMYKERLINFLDYCKSEDIDNLLFVRFPHIVEKETYNRFTRANTAGDIIRDHGYDFINFERDPVTLSYDTNKDYYNYDHLNIYGSEKFTKYFGNILTQQYGIEKSELNEENREKWDKSVVFYNKFYNYVDDYIQKKKGYINLDETDEVIKEVEEFSK